MKIFGRSTITLLLAAAAVPAWTGLSAQVQDQVGANAITVTGEMPTQLAGLPKGPVSRPRKPPLDRIGQSDLHRSR